MPNTPTDSVFDKNVEILKKRHPEVARYINQVCDNHSVIPFVLGTENRNQTIYVRQREGIHPPQPLYSKKALSELLHRMVSVDTPAPYNVVFLLGVGLGETCLTAVNQYKRKPHIVVIEPYLSVFKIALQANDLGRFLSYERLHIYLGLQVNPKKIVEDCKRILPVGRTLLFIYPYQRQLTNGKYKQVENELTHQIRAARDIWHNTRRFGQKMMINAITNLPSLLSGTPLRVLRDRFSGASIICVAAGPSLTNALPYLKSVKNTLILACDSAVGSLLQAGIRPHFVATADMHPSNIDKLKPHIADLDDTVLAFGVESNPDNVELFSGQRRVGMTAYNRLLIDWLDRPLNLQCCLEQMTTVTHLAVLLSIAMGANTVILVGVDMAFLGGKSHAHGAVCSKIPENINLVPVKSTNGSIVYAPPQLVTDRLILEQIIASHSVRVINTSLEGAFVYGAEVKSIKDAVNSELGRKVDLHQILDSIPWNISTAKELIHSESQKVIDEFKKLEMACKRQHQYIVDALKQYNINTGSETVESVYVRIKKGRRYFQEQFRPFIETLQDAMLTEIQALIKKEEMMAVTIADKTRMMFETLEAVDATYVTLANIAGIVIDGLETIQNLQRNDA